MSLVYDLYGLSYGPYEPSKRQRCEKKNTGLLLGKFIKITYKNNI